MPRLLIVTTVASTLRAFLLPYAQHFKKKNWTVDAMARGVDDCAECRKNFDHCHEVAFDRNPLHLHNVRELCEKIRTVVTEGRYDIVHVHTPVGAFITRTALRKFPAESRPKIVYTAHGFHFYKGGNFFGNVFVAALERLAGDWTDHTITINGDDYKAAVDCRIAPGDRLSLFPGIGLDFGVYSSGAVQVADVKKFCTTLNLAKDDHLFLMAAEFIPRKRHQDALRALAATGRTDFHLAFAGSGPRESAMKQLAAKLGLESQVHFLGERDDVPLLMLSSHAVILPSSQEGLNRSVMESICLGVPVLGSDARGIRDIITTPERGQLFPVGNIAALAAAMILSVEEPRGEKPVPNPEWSIGNLLAEHEKLYQSLIEKSLIEKNAPNPAQGAQLLENPV